MIFSLIFGFEDKYVFKMHSENTFHFVENMQIHTEKEFWHRKHRKHRRTSWGGGVCKKCVKK